MITIKKLLTLLLGIALAATLAVGLTSCDEKPTFSLKFTVDGEVYATVETSGKEVIEIPENPEKDGYTFDGWYWDNNKWENPLTLDSLSNAPLSADIRVYAKWNCIHVLSDWLVETKPTCTEEGLKYKECTKCSERIETESISALEHDIEHHEEKAPTCTEIGWDAYECCIRTGCNYTTYVEKSIVEHFDEDKNGYCDECNEVQMNSYNEFGLKFKLPENMKKLEVNWADLCYGERDNAEENVLFFIYYYTSDSLLTELYLSKETTVSEYAIWFISVNGYTDVERNLNEDGRIITLKYLYEDSFYFDYILRSEALLVHVTMTCDADYREKYDPIFTEWTGHIELA